MTTAWQAITEDQWLYALWNIPPEKHQKIGEVEIFRYAEHESHNTSKFFAQYQGRRFTSCQDLMVDYSLLAREIKNIS